MMDHLQTDPTVLNANANDYSTLLARATSGHALWGPDVGGNLGDCGQILGGRFYKYFNVLEEPESGRTFPRLKFDPQKDAHHIHTYQEDNTGQFKSQADIHFSMTVEGTSSSNYPPNTSVSISAGVELTNNKFAFLDCRGPPRTIQDFDPVMQNRVEQYLIEYGSRIRASALEGVSGTVIVLTKVVHSQAYVAGLATQSSAKVSGDVNVGVLSSVAAAVHTTYSTTRREGQTPTSDQDAGPHDAGAHPHGQYSLPIHMRKGGSENVPNQKGDFCVIVGYIQARASKKLRARMKSLFLCQRHASQPDAAGRSPGFSVEAPVTRSAPGDGGRGSGKGPMEADTPSDPLSKLIERALDANPTLELVVARWDIITDFHKKYGVHNFDLETGVEIVLESLPNDVARIMKLVPSQLIPPIRVLPSPTSAIATYLKGWRTSIGPDSHNLSVDETQDSARVLHMEDYRLARTIDMPPYARDDVSNVGIRNRRVALRKESALDLHQLLLVPGIA